MSPRPRCDCRFTHTHTHTHTHTLEDDTVKYFVPISTILFPCIPYTHYHCPYPRPLACLSVYSVIILSSFPSQFTSVLPLFPLPCNPVTHARTRAHTHAHTHTHTHTDSSQPATSIHCVYTTDTVYGRRRFTHRQRGSSSGLTFDLATL